MSFRKMSFRQSILLVGCVSLLAMTGLVIMLIILGLAVGSKAVAHSPPTPTPIAGAVGTVEAIEDVRQILGRDTLSAVTDGRQ